MRWVKSRRVALENHVITGKVGFWSACHDSSICYSCWCTHQTSVFCHCLVNSPDSSSSVSSIRSQSRLMSALYWLCGMEKRNEGENNVTPPTPKQATCSLKEKPRLKLIVNVNLIICISVTAFIIGYWAWQTWYSTLYVLTVFSANCVVMYRFY